MRGSSYFFDFLCCDNCCLCDSICGEGFCRTHLGSDFLVGEGRYHALFPRHFTTNLQQRALFFTRLLFYISPPPKFSLPVPIYPICLYLLLYLRLYLRYFIHLKSSDEINCYTIFHHSLCNIPSIQGHGDFLSSHVCSW